MIFLSSPRFLSTLFAIAIGCGSVAFLSSCESLVATGSAPDPYSNYNNPRTYPYSGGNTYQQYPPPPPQQQSYQEQPQQQQSYQQYAPRQPQQQQSYQQYPPRQPQQQQSYQQYPPRQPQQQSSQQYPPQQQQQSPPPPPQAPAQQQIPYATKTSTPNVVLSPYPPNSQIDVTGFKSGQQAIDPKTNKIFIVP